MAKGIGLLSQSFFCREFDRTRAGGGSFLDADGAKQFQALEHFALTLGQRLPVAVQQVELLLQELAVDEILQKLLKKAIAWGDSERMLEKVGIVSAHYGNGHALLWTRR